MTDQDAQEPLRRPPKVRRVDLCPDEFIAGILGMTPEEAGIFLAVILLTYSTGHPIELTDERLGRILKVRSDRRSRVIYNLAARGKFDLKSSGSRTEVHHNRTLSELEVTQNRILNNTYAGIKSGISRRKAEHASEPTTNYQLSTTKGNGKIKFGFQKENAREPELKLTDAQRAAARAWDEKHKPQ